MQKIELRAIKGDDMNCLKIFSIIMLLLLSSFISAFDLKKGLVSGEGNWSVLTKTDRNAGYYPKAVVESNEDGVVYIFDGSIGKTNYKENKFLGGWPLSRWQYYIDYKERLARRAEHSLSEPDFSLNIKAPLGCLSNTPLRYGDIESDGDQELVLFLGNDLVIFSPSYQRIVFSASLSLQDWMNASDTEFIYTDEFGKVEKAETEPQYASSLANTFRMIPGGPPGYRGYAKIFQGDFDKDGAFDLVVWQKVYESKLENESQRGFTLLNNRYMHFERDFHAQAESETGITGEYLPQETAEATIQTWLSENKLTWSKGFPSVSECEGEEGKLIPEMHDPLLNDPDVLQ